LRFFYDKNVPHIEESPKSCVRWMCSSSLNSAVFDWEGVRYLQREIHEPKKDVNILEKEY
jgi:hypothetical protein